VTWPDCNTNGDSLPGTWQGISLCEHRDRGGPRHLMLTVNGERRTASGDPHVNPRQLAKIAGRGLVLAAGGSCEFTARSE